MPRSKHNMVYWEGGTFYGFGMGSASYLQARRFSRPKRLGAYRQWVEALTAEATQRGRQLPGGELAPESADDLLLDTIMLRLRLADGLDLRQLAAQHPDGQQAVTVVLGALQRHIEAGLVLVGKSDSSKSSSGAGESRNSNSSGAGGSSPENPGVVRLADPGGFLVSNDILSDVFAAFDITQHD